ncbi:MAG: hypothetical protein AAF597_21100, partial [Bacteroidota bacterium]
FKHYTYFLMTYQEKTSLISKTVERINAGLDWDTLQNELKNTSGLYQKDIDDINRKVVKAVEGVHGTRIHAELLEDPEKVAAGGLDPVIFQKIRKRQEDAIRNTFKNRIARDLANGKPTAEVLVAHQHPLLQEDDYRRAAQKARNRLMEKAESESNRNPLNLVLGLLFLFGGLGLTMASEGQTIFYGAVLVGLGMIIKFAIG